MKNVLLILLVFMIIGCVHVGPYSKANTKGSGEITWYDESLNIDRLSDKEVINDMRACDLYTLLGAGYDILLEPPLLAVFGKSIAIHIMASRLNDCMKAKGYEVR